MATSHRRIDEAGVDERINGNSGFAHKSPLHDSKKESCQVPETKQLVIAFNSEVFASCEDASPDSRYGLAGVAQVGAVESEYTGPSMSTCQPYQR